MLSVLAALMALSMTGCGAATPAVESPTAGATTVPATQAVSVVPQRGGPGGSSTFASVAPTYEDLAYADRLTAQKLDLYIPDAGSGPFPVVVMVHGGGFMMGDKADGAGLTGVDQLLDGGLCRGQHQLPPER